MAEWDFMPPPVVVTRTGIQAPRDLQARTLSPTEVAQAKALMREFNDLDAVARGLGYKRSEIDQALWTWLGSPIRIEDGALTVEPRR